MSDIVFFSSLLICISLGCYYKKISDAGLKRNYGTGLGILLACVICGQQIFYTAIMVWGNLIIIKCCDRRYMHQLCLTFTWIFLIYLHFNTYTKYALWIYQAMALRLVGLAFEMHHAQLAKSDQTKSNSRLNMGDFDFLTKDPSAVEIITYAYFFIGLHKVRLVTIELSQNINSKRSYCMYYTKKFYTNYGSDFRYLYNIPHLVMHFLYHQIIMLLCTSVCTEAGFGVYPAICTPLPGAGPTTRISILKVLRNESTEKAFEEEYNFSAIKCFHTERVIMGPRMRDTIRSWYMPTRFWFWANIYKSVIKANKEMKLPWDIGFSIMRMFCLIYLTPCLIINNNTYAVLRYYNSIFWVYHIVLVALMIASVVIYKWRGGDAVT
ncbi:unnamed protein product [Leptidea sinapis]|uniref:Lysophospholipid acyltransferase 7 n=1 Tax=Leptidea sinapis TaxID=189913 RepID=A0A5E4PT24_9NEOP|nr:unnamed protein product [Leptidea sinapis]